MLKYLLFSTCIFTMPHLPLPGRSAAVLPPHKSVLKIVRLRGMRFDPSSIEIAVGDTVRWINDTNDYHNVVFPDFSYKQEMPGKGNTVQYVFEQVGEFKYYCKPHRMMGMKGVVEVK